jgi:hypothetical protein
MLSKTALIFAALLAGKKLYRAIFPERIAAAVLKLEFLKINK